MKGKAMTPSALLMKAIDCLSFPTQEIVGGWSAGALYLAKFYADDVAGKINCFSPWGNTAITDPSDVGRVCKFIHTNAHGYKSDKNPPEHLKGATESGSFEDVITKEGLRLSQQGLLDLGRYPVASVMIAGSDRPVQMPSLPDFEGVFPSGRQFIFEAKVCGEAAFPLNKSKLKPRQIRHMLRRSAFNVPCFLLIHFNERLGKTFYDPPATYALPIKAVDLGGLPLWAKYADSDGESAGTINRNNMVELGATPVKWHTPARCRSVRPNLFSFLKDAQ